MSLVVVARQDEDGCLVTTNWIMEQSHHSLQVCRVHGRSGRYTMTLADPSTAVCCRCTKWCHCAGVRVSLRSYECRPWRQGRRRPGRIQCGSHTRWHHLSASGCTEDTWSSQSLKTWTCRSQQNKLEGDKHKWIRNQRESQKIRTCLGLYKKGFVVAQRRGNGLTAQQLEG